VLLKKDKRCQFLVTCFLGKKNDICEVVASDLEVQLSSSLILEKESDFSHDITIPGRKLFDIGKGLPDELKFRNRNS
jgi:DNA polymerase III sliding clamp (beta) subunit (PCNA family)